MPNTDGINGLENALKMMNGLNAFDQADALFSANRTVLRKHVIKPAQTARPNFRLAFGVGADKEDRLGTLAGARVGGRKTGKTRVNDKGKTVNIKTTHKVLLWEEYGTSGRTTSKGANKGVFPKNPFFRSLVAQAIRPIIKELNSDYGKLVGRYLKRKGIKTK